MLERRQPSTESLIEPQEQHYEPEQQQLERVPIEEVIRARAVQEEPDHAEFLRIRRFLHGTVHSDSTETPFWDEEDYLAHLRMGYTRPLRTVLRPRGSSVESKLSRDENGQFRPRRSVSQDSADRARLQNVEKPVTKSRSENFGPPDELADMEDKKANKHQVYRNLVAEWKNSFLVGEFAVPLPPMLDTVGLTKDQKIRLSYIVHEATQPPINTEPNFIEPGSQPEDLFIMVHQTNEREVIEKLGSARMNPWTENRKDVEGLAYLEADAIVKSIIFKLTDGEAVRRNSESHKVYDHLSLEEAFNIGQNKPIRKDSGKSTTSLISREHFNYMGYSENLPVVKCSTPVVGMPFKAYVKYAVDLVTCQLDLLRAINIDLAKTGLQIIDLRVRAEDAVTRVPDYPDEDVVGRDVVTMIQNSVDTLTSLRNTAKYFVVYGFENTHCPMRFYQAVVRFRPGLPIVQQDWNEHQTPRSVISDEPEPGRLDFEILFEPPYPEALPRVFPDSLIEF